MNLPNTKLNFSYAYFHSKVKIYSSLDTLDITFITDGLKNLLTYFKNPVCGCEHCKYILSNFDVFNTLHCNDLNMP